MDDKFLLSSLSLKKGQYYFIEKQEVGKLYKKFWKESTTEPPPNYLTIDNLECLFTENFIEKNGKTYELVLVANDFSWSEVIKYEQEFDKTPS
jgi:hypothetical protein